MNQGHTRCGLSRASSRGFSAIFVTAALSAFVLLAVASWQISAAIRGRTNESSYVAASTGALENADALASSTLLSGTAATPIGASVFDGLVSKYLSLQEQGLYTQEVGEKTAEKMAEGLKVPIPFHTYAAADITTTADTSYTRMLTYRADLQLSLAPLLKNTQPEYEIFAYYINTKDKKNLEKLQAAAQNYRAAASATAHVVAPKDALSAHVDMLNSMEKFAATLDTLAANADDPFAAVTVLRSYNEAETDVLSSFASLAKYYREKKS